MWSKVSCLKKQHENEETNLASNHQPSDLPSKSLIEVRLANHYDTSKLKADFIAAHGYVSSRLKIAAGLNTFETQNRHKTIESTVNTQFHTKGRFLGIIVIAYEVESHLRILVDVFSAVSDESDGFHAGVWK